MTTRTVATPVYAGSAWGSVPPAAQQPSEERSTPSIQNGILRPHSNPAVEQARAAFSQEISRIQGSNTCLMETLQATEATFQRFAEESVATLTAANERTHQLEEELILINAQAEERKIAHEAEMKALRQSEQQLRGEIAAVQSGLRNTLFRLGCARSERAALYNTLITHH